MPRPPKSTPGKSPRRARLRRHVRVTGAAARVGVRLAARKYLSGAGDRDTAAADAEFLKNILGNLKGPLMKVAQIVAAMPDTLSPSYADILRQLHSQAPVMGASFVRRRLRAELGDGWETAFDTFDMTAAHAASLGQVHRATRGGQTLACKVQYPDMQAAVDADMAQIKVLYAFYRRRDPSIDADNVFAELDDRLREELDYRREARHIALFRTLLAKEEGVAVPQVIDDLSTDRLLTMTWLDGDGLLARVAAPPKNFDAAAVARRLFRAWYVPLYHYGVLHGDPHPGNYTLDAADHLNLLDFGCVRVFSPAFVHGVVELYYGLLEHDAARVRRAYESWGFENLTPDLLETLNIWANFVYAPLLQDKVQPLAATNASAYGRQKAAEVHARLRRIGGIRPPREFVLMDRAALGLGSAFLHLGAEVNWCRLFQEILAEADLKSLEKRQRQALNSVGL